MIRINLIPREARPDRTIYYQLFFGVVILAVTLLVVVVWWIKLNDEIATLKDDIQRKKEELKKLEYVRKKVQEFEDKKALLIRKRETIINLQKIQRGPVLILMELNRARPQNQVWLSDMSMVGADMIKLRGAGLSYSSIGDFMNELSRRPIFENVKLESSVKEVQGNRQIYKFSLHFNIVLAAIEGQSEES
jgi:Tfp pilus assembly protein PilN